MFICPYTNQNMPQMQMYPSFDPFMNDEFDRQRRRPKIILFENINFSGRSLVVTSREIPNLVQLNFNDLVSSVIVINGTWELFEHVNYKGKRYVVSANGGPFGDGTYPTWTAWNGVNDQISSLRQRGR